MTDEEKRAAYLEWINAETGQSYSEADGEELPALVELVLDKLLEMDGDAVNVKSITQGGRSITFADGMSGKMVNLLRPLRKLRW